MIFIVIFIGFNNEIKWLVEIIYEFRIKKDYCKLDKDLGYR